MIEFTLTEEQIAIQKMASEFAINRIRPVSAYFDEHEEDPISLFREMIDQGFSSITFPEKYGGEGLDELTAALAVEELAWGCAGITGSGMVNNPLGAYPILIGGNDNQKEKFIPPLCKGKFISFCLTEPNAGSDVISVNTVAKRVNDHYIINGTKCFITNGGFADYYTVFASVNGNRGAKGLTAFIIKSNTKGVFPGKKEKKMGIRASNTSEVIFDNVKVPLENRIGAEGQGFSLALKTLDYTRPMIGAIAVGISRAAYETVKEYVKERKQFGKPLSQFQVTQFKLADMAIEIDAARLMVWRSAYLSSKKENSFSTESAMAKAFASDIAMKVTTEAIQMMGGYGYCKDYLVEKFMRDAKITQIYEGTNEIQRIIIASNVLQ